MDRKLLIATTNAGKAAELATLTAELGLEILSLADVGIDTEVAETGDTFAENARKKASEYAAMSGIATLADDSGLEVTVIGGRPGVLSARYFGSAPYPEKMAHLLEEVGKASGDDRRARFVCAVAVADRNGRIVGEEQGIVDGTLAAEPRGVRGFGYDPIFIPEGCTRTFGEMSADEKRELSHRGRALLKIIPFLQRFFSVLT